MDFSPLKALQAFTALSRAFAKITHRSKSSIPQESGRTRETSVAMPSASARASFSLSRISAAEFPVWKGKDRESEAMLRDCR